MKSQSSCSVLYRNLANPVQTFFHWFLPGFCSMGLHNQQKGSLLPILHQLPFPMEGPQISRFPFVQRRSQVQFRFLPGNPSLAIGKN